MLKNQKGQGLLDYALIIALVAIVVIAVITLLSEPIQDLFEALFG